MFGRSVRADDAERTGNLPADEFVEKPIASITHAITSGSFMAAIFRNRKDTNKSPAPSGAGATSWVITGPFGAIRAQPGVASCRALRAPGCDNATRIHYLPFSG